METNTGLILGLRPATGRRRYFVTTSLIGWAQTLNHPWNTHTLWHNCLDCFPVAVRSLGIPWKFPVGSITCPYVKKLPSFPDCMPYSSKYGHSILRFWCLPTFRSHWETETNALCDTTVLTGYWVLDIPLDHIEVGKMDANMQMTIFH